MSMPLVFCMHHANELAHDVQHIIALDKAHFEVDLRELSLAIGARVFIAKAFAKLEIAIAATQPSESA